MKDTTRSAIIALFAAVAVAIAASTVDSTLTPERGGPSGAGGGSDGGGGGLVPPESSEAPGEALQIPFLREVLIFLLVVSALLCLVYVVLHWRETLGTVLAGVVLFALVVLLFQLLSLSTGTPGLPLAEPGDGGLLGGSEESGAADTVQPVPPSLLVFFVLGFALVGAVVVLVRTAPDDVGTVPDEGDGPARHSDDGTANVAEVGRVAGQAADRIEGESAVDNEVYRTWREMTELLDVEQPRTSTPGEFAAAAVDAGLGREDVAELTQLFEGVRYGGQAPSEERERQAVEVFRRIERRYGEDDE